ncbi:MAG: hypothetical protein LRS43_03645, partial [Desulfurococcales archaeon]|nr:hypothetical protein [Desulfurococcales archaeon]
PSLSLGVFLATLSAIEGLRLRPGYMVTGLINPDLTVGFVADVKAKAMAASSWGYSVFLYPAMQDREYRVVKRPLYLGPYMVEVEVVESQSIGLEELNISSIPVSTGAEAYSLLSGSPTVARVSLENLTRRLSKPHPVFVEGMVGVVEERLEWYLSEARRIVESLAEHSVSPLVLDLKARIDSVKAEKGYSSVRQLLDSLEQAARLYYTALIISGDLSSARTHALAARETAGRLLDRAAREAPLSGLPLVALSAMKYVESEGALRESLVFLEAMEAGFASPQRHATDTAALLARASRGFYESALLALAGMGGEGPGLYRADLGRLARIAVDYAAHLYELASEYSSQSGIRSNLTSMAAGNLVKARELLAEDTPLETLASIGYSIESSTLSSLFMSLHPGYPGVAELRLEASLQMLQRLLELTGYPEALLFLLEPAAEEDAGSTLYYVEKAIVASKLLIAASQEMGVKLGRPKYEQSEQLRVSQEGTSMDGVSPPASAYGTAAGLLALTSLALLLLFFFLKAALTGRTPRA